MPVGKWEIEVSEPYPCWCRITYDGQEIYGIRHGELLDLEYAVQRAIREVYGKLPERDRHEIAAKIT